VIPRQLDSPESSLEWTLARLHAAIALRPEEALGLKWPDIDWQRGQINLRRWWSKVKETAGKRERSMTQVAMQSSLSQSLQAWRGKILLNDLGSNLGSEVTRGKIQSAAKLLKGFGGPGRDRTDDLFHAMEARSQLRHRPTRRRTTSILSPLVPDSSNRQLSGSIPSTAAVYGTPPITAGFWHHPFAPLHRVTQITRSKSPILNNRDETQRLGRSNVPEFPGLRWPYSHTLRRALRTGVSRSCTRFWKHGS
jgi:hypothetical protein